MFYAFGIAELNFDSENIRVIIITFIKKSLNRLVQNAEVCYFKLMGLQKFSCATRKWFILGIFGWSGYHTVYSIPKAE